MSPTWLHWPSTWTPAEMPSLAGWWKADAITGLSDADPVSTWSDESASGWDATASGTDRPTYKTAIQNGLPVVRFNGSNHLNLGSTDLFRNVGGGTVYGVLRPDSPSTRGLWLTVTKPTSGSRVQIETGWHTGSTHVYRSGGRRLDADFFADALSKSPVTTQWVTIGAVFDWLSAHLLQYIDGELDGANLTFQTPGFTSNTASVADGTNIGAAHTSNTLGFLGDIAEIVVTHSALSTADRERLEGYLAHKWGLETNLPSTHPYRNSAP